MIGLMSTVLLKFDTSRIVTVFCAPLSCPSSIRRSLKRCSIKLDRGVTGRLVAVNWCTDFPLGGGGGGWAEAEAELFFRVRLGNSSSASSSSSSSLSLPRREILFGIRTGVFLPETNVQFDWLLFTEGSYTWGPCRMRSSI